MLKILEARWQQRFRTIAFPKDKPVLPERFRGLPKLDQAKCQSGCEACVAACPTGAIQKIEGKGVAVDLGKCLFCADCVKACPQGAISYSRDFRLATRRREDLILSEKELPLAQELERKMLKLFGRSLRLRQVSAGGCNACEADTNVLTTVVFDLGRFGIQFVASPRHAEGILVTGPVTENMKLALQKTYHAVSSPKIVIAVGACAISGGPYIDEQHAPRASARGSIAALDRGSAHGQVAPDRASLGHSQVHNGADSILPVDLYIPGCPPHPLTILDGLLRLLGRIPSDSIPKRAHGPDRVTL